MIDLFCPAPYFRRAGRERCGPQGWQLHPIYMG